MRDNIYEYLREFGFSKDSLKNFENVNEEMYFVELNEVKTNISFLLNLGFTNEEIVNIINNNPFILTIAKNRNDYFIKLYVNILNFSKDELKQLILNNNESITSSPIELEKIVNYLYNDKQYNYVDIKSILLNNSKIISMTFNEFLNVVI